MNLQSEDFQASQQLLEQLIEEVAQLEGHLGDGDAEPDPNSSLAVLQSFKKSEVWLGDPQSEFYALEAPRPEKSAYLIRLPMALKPAPGARFDRITCRCVFDSPGCDWSPQLVRVFPEHRYVALLEYTRSLTLGVDESLGWALPELPDLTQLAAGVKAEIAGEIAAEAKVRIPEMTYRVGAAEIKASGVGSVASWEINADELLTDSKIDFAMILQTPADCAEMTIQCTYAAYPSVNWFGARLGDLFEYLSDKLKAVLRHSDKPRAGADGLPFGKAQEPIILRTDAAGSLGANA